MNRTNKKCFRKGMCGVLIVFFGMTALTGGLFGCDAHFEHTYGAWTVTQAATCSAAGTRERACTKKGCKKKEQEHMEATGHWYGNWTSTATCLEAGHMERICIFCHNREQGEATEALGHAYTDEAACHDRACIRADCGHMIRATAEHVFKEDAVNECLHCGYAYTMGLTYLDVPGQSGEARVGNNAQLTVPQVVVPKQNEHGKTVTGMVGHAFYQNPALQKITFSNAVRAIYDHTFEGCAGLQEVIAPEQLTYIGSSAFAGCTALKEIRLPAGLEFIGWGAFAGAGLTSITIPDTVKHIDDYAFAGCAALMSVTMLCPPPAVSTGLFGQTALRTVAVPAALIEAYRAHADWSALGLTFTALV